MKAKVKCKACGFIMPAEKVGEVCPACGVPSKMFEPYTDNVSEKRQRILAHPIHPIIVHAPQAFTFFLVVVAFTPYLTVLQSLHGDLFVTVRILAFCLPFTLVGAILSGLLDGKTRFRKLGTPILKKKIILGGMFFGLSLILLAITQMAPQWSYGTSLLIIALTTGCFICSVILGLLGASLVNARFPG